MKPRGAARPNLKRRSPTKRKDGGPPPPAEMDRKLLGLKDGILSTQPPPFPSVDLRHLRRYMESILLETRTTRQYIMWLHEMLANHELGKEAEIPTQKVLKQEMRDRELTLDEQARIAAGEDVEVVLPEL